jgi:FkbM family methyltransferase
MFEGAALFTSLRQCAKQIVGPAFAPRVRLWLGTIDKNQFYDVLAYEIMKRCLGRRSVCVDVGCHKGLFLRWMMELATDGTFYAFEPLPELYKNLTASFPFPHVKIFNLALSNKPGIVSFNHVISNPGYSGLLKRRYDRPNETDCTISVSTDLLDSVIDQADHVDFIKIDVEGAEYQVLQGAVNTIKKCRPIILFEHGLGGSDCYGTRPEHVYDLLCGDCGLKVSLLEGWLNGRRALSRDNFREQFDKGLNYYFIAHPASI